MEEQMQEMQNLRQFVDQFVHGQMPQKHLLPAEWQESFERNWIDWFEAQKYLSQLAQGNFSAEPPKGESAISGKTQMLHQSLQFWQQKYHVCMEKEQAELCAKWYEIYTTQQVMFHVITHMHSGVIAVELGTGELIYQNEYYKQWKTKNLDKTEHVKNCLNMWGNEQKEIWYITMQNEALEKDRMQILMVQSFVWQWRGKPAVIHVLTDYSAEHMRQKRMEEAAFTDVLTGLYNRRYGQIRIQRLVEEQVPFLFCFIDMDGLKYINDTLGHAKGDLAIRQVADVLQHVFRRDDTIIRIGGDEFVVILPQCSVELAETRFELAHQLLQTTDIPYRITFSYGIEPVFPGEKRNIEEIFSTADHKMYQHKQNKRRV